MWMLCWMNKDRQNKEYEGNVCGTPDHLFTVYFYLKQTGKFNFRLVDSGGHEIQPTTETCKNLPWYVG